jgi:hypothetical protein
MASTIRNLPIASTTTTMIWKVKVLIALQQ